MLGANFNIKNNTCNRRPDFQPVNLHDEVIFQEEEPNDGEEINQDERQHCSEDNGTTVPGDTFYHIQQRLFSVHQIKQLGKAQSRGKMNTNEAIYRCFIGKESELLKRTYSHVLNSQLHKYTIHIDFSGSQACSQKKFSTEL